MRAFISVAAFVLAATSHQEPPGRDKPPRVQVDKAENSVVAGEVKGDVIQHNYYRSEDPVDRKFSETLTLHAREKFEASAGSKKSGSYSWLYDSRDKRFAIADTSGGTYSFVAGNPMFITVWFGPNVETCPLADGNVIAGQYMAGNLTGRRYRFFTVLLPRDNPLLRRICHDLKDSAGDSYLGEDITRFDLLSAEEEDLLHLSVIPDSEAGHSFENAYATRYWLGFELGMEFSKLTAVEAFLGRPRVKAMTQELIRRGKVEVSVDLDARFPRQDAFPELSVRTYGNRLDRLSDDWQSFLRSANLRWNGRRVRMMEGNALVPIVRRVSFADFENGRAWDRVEEGNDYLYQLACLAGAFAVQRGYSSPADVPFFRQCAV